LLRIRADFLQPALQRAAQARTAACGRREPLHEHKHRDEYDRDEYHNAHVAHELVSPD
jgi:hypothetical protein